MKILLTGGSGFVGGGAAGLLRKRHEVAAPSHAEMDVLDAAAVRRVMKREMPDAVIHLAALSSKEKCERDRDLAFRLNGEGARRVAEAAAELGVFMLHMSTDFVFSGEQKEFYRETDETSPMTAYGESKLLGEKNAREVCGAGGCLIIRTTRVFGVSGKGFISTLPARLIRGDRIKLIGDDLSSFAHLPDLVRGMESLLTARAVGIYHVVNTGACATWEFGERIREKLGVSTPIEKVKVVELAETPPAPRFRTLSTGKYHSAGFEPLGSWREAQDRFLETAEFYRIF